jgi:hypothetical protein
MFMSLYPVQPVYFWVLASLVVIWSPWQHLMSGLMSRRLRLGVLILVCMQTVFAITSAGSSGAVPHETSLACWAMLAWLCVLLTVSNNAVASLPLAMIATLCAAVSVAGDSEARAVSIFAALALIISGSIYFYDSVVRPRVPGGWFRRRFWGFSGHVVVLSLCLGLALVSYDWALSQVGSLSGIVPDSGGSKKSTVQLDGRPPQFKGAEICAVHSTRGTLPKYLAETVFYTYLQGRWVAGRSAWSGGTPAYGIGRRDKDRLKTRAHCYVSMMHLKTWPLVPFGSVRPDFQPQMADPRLPMAEPISASYTWGDWPAGADRKLVEVGDIEHMDRLKGLAVSIMAGADDDIEKVRHVETWLAQNTFYDASLAFTTKQGDDAVEQFLLRSKRGWCVHYASACALLLRAEGIPTRFVSGYMVVAPPGAKTVAVVDSTAHAWCEAFVNGPDGPKWVIVDASYAPLGRAPLYSAKWRHAIGIVVMLLIVLGMFHARLSMHTGDLRRELAVAPEDRTAAASIEAAYHRILRYFERLGVSRQPSQTPREFARELTLAPYRDDFLIITRAFERVKYMGYRDLGADLDQVEKAQRRILGMDKRPRRARQA